MHFRHEEPDTPDRCAARRRIADAILASFSGDIEEIGPYAPDDATWIELYVPGLEIVVSHDHLHLRLRWRSVSEMEELCLTQKLRQLEAVVRDVAGFDFFEHGCQGIGRRGDIDMVPEVIAGTTGRIRAVFGAAT